MKIHLVKTRLVNSYIIEYPDRLLVVDVAVKCHRYVLGYIEQELKRPVSDVELVICTHDDADHMGGIFALARLCEADVAIPFASGRGSHKLANNPTGGLRRLLTSGREMFRARAWDMYFNKDRDRAASKQAKHQQPVEDSTSSTKSKINYRLKGGNGIPGFDDWQIVHTPGHSWDSCCYYHPQTSSLITGDTLLGSGKENRLVVASIYSSRRQTVRTLKKLSKLNVSSVYPGHGSVISGTGLIGRHNLP
jgi:glyoxylase-like metal-dependent hydrolase (beta-lactamase superfamily II)